MILNDKEIKELCIMPTFVVSRWIKKDPSHVDAVFDVFVEPELVDSFTHQTEEELLKEVAESNHVIKRGTKCFRKLTPEELSNFNPMIENFIGKQVKTRKIPNRNQDSSFHYLEPEDQRIVSYGLSSFGYDFRVANEFKIFTNINSTVVDPLNFDDRCFTDFVGDVCIVPPNSFVLARTVEKFNIPPDIVGICTGKSTIARSGLSILVTPLEPNWSGFLTLEFANTTPLPVKLHSGMGGGQIMFYRGNRPDVTYADRNGKYQNQGPEVVTPRV